ncbi:MAG: hypothetical protein K2P57_13485 [Burkholderiales bacterium]|nr:hypothetical protein [Burkholderiales bacterium]
MLKVLLLAGGLCLSSLSQAAGLGELKVISALGQPLRAEIDLVSMRKGESESLAARIAPVDAYKLAGVEYNPLLANVKVSIAARPDGQPYVKLASPEVVNDPFVDVMIEVSWSSGQLRREYTMLFDPVEFAKAPVVSPPASMPEKRVESPSAPAPEKAEAKAEKYGPVKRGETLSGIALATKPEDISLEQMLVALYQANEQAFEGKNMNILKAGKILRIPGSEEIASIGKNEAVKVVKVQAVDWNAYRQKLASTVVERGGGLRRSVSGKITASVENKAASVSPQSQEVLKLSKGEASSVRAEEQAAQIKSLNDASERILMLEKNIQEMRKLLAMKNKALAEAKGAASAPIAIPHAAPPKAAPSFFDDIMGNPVLLGVAGGTVLGLAGIGMLIARRRKTVQDVPMPAEQAARRSEPGLERPILKDASIRAGEPDPLEEARLYFSYRRYAQAEEIVKEALQSDPANFEAHLLLMKIHALGNDKDALELAARRLQAVAPPSEIWAQAMEIGFSADPKNPLYGGAVKDAAVHEHAAIEAEPSKESLDFDLDFDSGSAAGSDVDLNLGEHFDVLPEEKSGAIDFDLSSMAEAPVATQEAAAEEEASIDFDMSSMIEVPPAGAEEEAPVDFDLTEFVEAAPEVSEFVEAAPEVSSMAEAPAATQEAPAEEEASIDFDMSSMIEVPPAGAEEEAPVDFDISSIVEEPAEVPQAPVDFDLSEFVEAAPISEFVEAAPELSSMIEAPPAGAEEEAPVDFDISSMVEEPAEVPQAPVDFDLSEFFEAAPISEFVEAAPTSEFVEAAPELSSIAGVEADEVAAKAPPPEISGFDISDIPTLVQSASRAREPEMVMPDVDLNLGEEPKASGPKEPLWYEVATKLDLAKVYQEMGDHEGAHEILEEVMNEGDADQRAMAKSMLGSLSKS